jgi:DNA-binding response OmpR family regulator
MDEPSKRKLLVIDDDSALCGILVERFRADGFDVASAGDGQEGLQKIIDWQPDIVLLDIVMPKMDGMTMLHKLRERESGKAKKTEVILLTNLNDAEKVYEAMSNEVFDYLVKSDWEIDDLVKEVRSKAKLPPTGPR